jgi:hypothetical protein
VRPLEVYPAVPEANGATGKAPTARTSNLRHTARFSVFRT